MSKFAFKKKLTVLKKELVRGIPGCTGRCPIALAVLRIVPGVKAVEVGGDCVTVTTLKKSKFKGEELFMFLPYNAQDFIDRFDRAEQDKNGNTLEGAELAKAQKKVKPVTFTLALQTAEQMEENYY